LQRRQSAPHSVNLPLDLIEWVDSVSHNRSAVITKALVEYRNRNDNFESKLVELNCKRRRMLDELEALDGEIQLVKSIRAEGTARDGVETEEDIEDLKSILGRHNDE